jgi:hypothetical protein
MHGETAAASGYVNADVVKTVDDDLAEAVVAPFTRVAIAMAVDHGIVATLTDANSRLTKQVE